MIATENHSDVAAPKVFCTRVSRADWTANMPQGPGDGSMRRTVAAPTCRRRSCDKELILLRQQGEKACDMLRTWLDVRREERNDVGRS